jgi:tRNA threonylcarbamoyladenosine biosynthesis protein TsaB
VGVGTGWQAYSTLNADDKVTVIEDILYPNAEHMLPLAKQGIEQGLAVEIEDMQPVYLRDKVTWKKLPGRE